jgi:hypothetical protein
MVSDGTKELGRICRNKILRPETPLPSAVLTNGESFISSIEARRYLTRYGVAVRPPVIAGRIIKSKFSEMLSDSGVNPLDGSHCKVSEKIKIRIIPITNPGMDNPIEVR